MRTLTTLGFVAALAACNGTDFVEPLVVPTSLDISRATAGGQPAAVTVAPGWVSVRAHLVTSDTHAEFSTLARVFRSQLELHVTSVPGPASFPALTSWDFALEAIRVPPGRYTLRVVHNRRGQPEPEITLFTQEIVVP